MALRSSVASQASAKASGRIAPRRMAVCVRAQQQEQVNVGRREFLQASAASVLLLASPGTALAAKGPKGFNPVQDLNDNYEFFYPFGWQEVSIQGADVVFKDVIEPLESVSVTITSTDRSDITEFGSLEEVTETLARSVLSSPDQQVKVIKAEERDSKGHKYYGVEFTANNGRFTRHQLAVVTVNDGKFYTLTTGSAEKRWGKMGDKLQTVANTFQLIN